jgi:hypothetical protein
LLEDIFKSGSTLTLKSIKTEGKKAQWKSEIVSIVCSKEFSMMSILNMLPA